MFSICLLKAEKIKVKKADRLKGGTFQGVKINKLLGNVLMEHETTLLYCDSAYQYTEKNEIIAFGRVRLIHKDSVNATGSKLVYNGDTRIALLTGERVVLTDPSMTLTTTALTYDLANNIGLYSTGGLVVSDKTELTSIRGKYNSNTKTYFFKDSVELFHEDYHLTSDTLVYNTRIEKASFGGPTHITSSEYCVFAKQGDYYFEEERCFLKTDSYVESDEYSISGDSLFFDNISGDGYGEENVLMRYFDDSVTIRGQYAVRYGLANKAKVFGEPITEKIIGGDTVFMTSDTLISISDTLEDRNDLFAFNNVVVFKSDLQALADSLYYNSVDSSITFYTDPILWNGDNQITCDTLTAFLKNGEIDYMLINRKSFIISLEEGGNFNQLKGKLMNAKFENGEISTVDVFGNGQSIYFANDDESGDMVGMNKVVCSKMLITFEESELSDIMFRTEPESNFIPKQKVLGPDMKMKGFKWRSGLRPSKDSVLRKQNNLE